jgi:hypothetical protein
VKSFKDANGRDWTVAVTIDSIKRVRALCGVDLLKVVEDGCKLLRQLSDDAVLLVDVLYALCKPEADADGVSDAQFGAAMAGDAILDGFNAVVEDTTDFFPRARREQLRALLGKIREAGELMDRDLSEALAGIDPAQILKAGRAEMRRKSKR